MDDIPPDSEQDGDWDALEDPAPPGGALACPAENGCGLDCTVSLEARPLTKDFLAAAEAAGFADHLYINEAKIIGVDRSKYYVAFMLSSDVMATEIYAHFMLNEGELANARAAFDAYFGGLSPRWIEGDATIDSAATLAALDDCYPGLAAQYDPCQHNTEDMRIEIESEEFGACGRPLAIVDLDPLAPTGGCDLSPEESCGDD